MRKYALAAVAAVVIMAGMLVFAAPAEADPAPPVNSGMEVRIRTYDLSHPQDRWALLWLMIGLDTETQTFP